MSSDAQRVQRFVVLQHNMSTESLINGVGSTETHRTHNSSCLSVTRTGHTTSVSWRMPSTSNWCISGVNAACVLTQKTQATPSLTLKQKKMLQLPLLKHKSIFTDKLRKSTPLTVVVVMNGGKLAYVSCK